MHRPRPLTWTLSLSLALTLGAFLAVPGAAATVPTAEPVLTVTPSTGLAGGDTVAVAATGLSPLSPVQLMQCDDHSCYRGATGTSDAAGRFVTNVVLADPVYRDYETNDGPAVYCRADVCRILLSWTDASGSTQLISSEPLEFTGSPATLEVNRSTDLRRTQRLRVHGTALGAEGQPVVVVQQRCLQIVQETGCHSAVVRHTGTIASDGTYAFGVRVTRFLPDGTDCADSSAFGFCKLTARILDAMGQPDESFGASRFGDPGVALTFRG